MRYEIGSAWAVWVAAALLVMPVVAPGCAEGHGDSSPDASTPLDGPGSDDGDPTGCTDDSECDDGTECHVSRCRNGACEHYVRHELCDDGAGCMAGVCSEGSCTLESSDGRCDDGNECTANACTEAGECEGVTNAPDGTTCQYGLGSCQAGECEVMTQDKSVFRAVTLSLEDPAIMLNCLDVTSVANGMIQDGVDDLDLNFVFTFDPVEDVSGTPVELWVADCEAQGEEEEEQTISCSAPDGQEPLGSDATTRSTGTCLEAREGDYFFGAPNTVEAPCWAIEPTDLEFDLEGIRIPLVDAQAAGTMEDADHIVNGLIKGFLSEETAQAVELPEEIAEFLGGPGATLADVLPPYGCSSNDARSVHEGELGWWFHLNFTAERVSEHDGF